MKVFYYRNKAFGPSPKIVEETNNFLQHEKFRLEEKIRKAEGILRKIFKGTRV